MRRVIEPYHEDLAIAVECVFVWYWIADPCAQLGITFVLGHALYEEILFIERKLGKQVPHHDSAMASKPDPCANDWPPRCAPF